MGTDIILVVEEKSDDGRWHVVRTFDEFIDEDAKSRRPAACTRNYKRFAALAGVRGEGPAPRGFPADVSDGARYLFERYGGVSPSWMPLDEATRVFAETDADPAMARKAMTDFEKPDSARNYYYFAELGEGPDYRLVFWFDGE